MHRVFDTLSPAPHIQRSVAHVCWGLASSDTERQADEGCCIKPLPFSTSSSLITLPDAFTAAAHGSLEL